jgi:hypothetical protein
VNAKLMKEIYFRLVHKKEEINIANVKPNDVSICINNSPTYYLSDFFDGRDILIEEEHFGIVPLGFYLESGDTIIGINQKVLILNPSEEKQEKQTIQIIDVSIAGIFVDFLFWDHFIIAVHEIGFVILDVKDYRVIREEVTNPINRWFIETDTLVLQVWDTQKILAFNLTNYL